MAGSRANAGTIIGGRYRLESLLGKGGMGSVWRAEHLTLKSAVAVKLIHDESMGEDAVARFMREAQSAAALRSPHVVQIFDHGVDNGIPYIAMELLEGETLAARLGRLKKLDPETTARIVSQVARAIARAHEAGVIHRDLKPDNVFLIQNDEEEVAKVLDFGIAKTIAAPLDGAASTRTGALIGTPYYMSPEQLRGAKQVDHRADLWALGVITFECLTGVRPFSADNIGELVLVVCSNPHPIPSKLAQVPIGFDAWCARATALDKDARFQSARELARELRALVGFQEPRPTKIDTDSGSSETVRARTGPGTIHSLSSTARKESKSGARRVLAIVSLLGLLAVVVLGVLLMKNRGTQELRPETKPAARPAEATPPVELTSLAEPSASPAVSVAPAISSSPVASASASSAPTPRPAVKSAPPAVSKPRPPRPAEGDPGVGF